MKKILLTIFAIALGLSVISGTSNGPSVSLGVAVAYAASPTPTPPPPPNYGCPPGTRLKYIGKFPTGYWDCI